MCLAAGLLVSCVPPPDSLTDYMPVTKPENMEYLKAHLQVYPEDVRKDPARYANVEVAWAGIIISTGSRITARATSCS